MWSEECQHRYPPLTCVHDMVDRCTLWYAVCILCYGGGWCRLVCICTWTYVDYSGWQTPPHTKYVHCCYTMLCCIHFVSSPIATMTIEHVMMHNIHQIHRYWWNVSISVFTVYLHSRLTNLTNQPTTRVTASRAANQMVPGLLQCQQSALS